MNIENAKKLVSQLERLPDEKFDMSVFIEHDDTEDGCGTVACIAGWTSLLNEGPGTDYHCGHHNSIFIFARNWLDLNHDEAMGLFLGDGVLSPWDKNRDISGISRSEAVKEIKRMIASAEPAGERTRV